MLQQLMDNISDLIYFKDLHGHFVVVNRTCARRFGHEQRPVVGIFGIFRNISELKERELQMEAELELAREVQQSFLEVPRRLAIRPA
jgi:PAS domain S-box-containing protein